MARAVPEVTHMAAKLKDNSYKIPGQEPEPQPVEANKKVGLVKKHPGGSAGRWERIAAAMARAVPEVTHMAAKLKDNSYKIPGQEPEPQPVEANKKVGLVKKHPGGSAERWERIAAAMARAMPEVTHMAAKLKDNCYKIPGQEPKPQPVEANKKVGLVLKHPGGSAERWERIAAAMARAVPEVTHMAAKLKDNSYKIPGQEPEPQPVEANKKVGLVKKHPGGSAERWERIAAAMARAVPEVTHMAAKLKDNCYRILTSNEGLVIGGLGDLNRPADKLSIPQLASLAATGIVWSRYSLVIVPKNYSLFVINVVVATINVYQLTRVYRYRQTLKK